MKKLAVFIVVGGFLYLIMSQSNEEYELPHTQEKTINSEDVSFLNFTSYEISGTNL